MDSNHKSQLQSLWDRLVERELEREKVDPGKRVHTDLLWREIQRCIEKTNLTILDAGGGFGRFSIPLAEAGYKVVHLDISSNMYWV